MTRTGRFSGKQVATITVAICVAVVGAPLGVLASTGSTVSISDAHHKHIAKVSKAGALSVNVGSKPIPVTVGTKPLAVTGSVTSKVSGAVTVNGAVTPGIPAKSFFAEGSLPGDADTDEIVWQGGSTPTNVAMTSVILSASGSTAGDATGYLAYYNQATPGVSCSHVSGHGFTGGERLPLSVPVGQTTEVTFPTPMVWGDYFEPGGTNCITMEMNAPAADDVTYAVTGYTQ